MANIDAMTPEERAKTKQQAKELLALLERDDKSARDEEVVWVETPAGHWDMCKYGAFRTYMSKHGARLLTPEEVEEAGEKVQNAAAVREEKQRLWRLFPLHLKERYLSPDNMTLGEMQDIVGDLEGGRGKKSAA